MLLLLPPLPLLLLPAAAAFCNKVYSIVERKANVAPGDGADEAAPPEAPPVAGEVLDVVAVGTAPPGIAPLKATGRPGPGETLPGPPLPVPLLLPVLLPLFGGRLFAWPLRAADDDDDAEIRCGFRAAACLASAAACCMNRARALSSEDTPLPLL